jgi:hypothetical protein
MHLGKGSAALLKENILFFILNSKYFWALLFYVANGKSLKLTPIIKWLLFVSKWKNNEKIFLIAKKRRILRVFDHLASCYV